LRERLDAQVKLVGLVGAVKKSQIKKGQNEGKMMAKAIVEDLTGSVPVTVFAGLLERVGSWLAPGRPVLVTGTVRLAMAPGGATHDPSENESAGMPIEIIAREIQLVEGMKEQSAREVLIVPQNFETFDEAALKEILRRYSGSVPVSLELRRPGHFAARHKIDSHLWVRPSPEFTASMETLLGPNSVRYSYAASP
jgi:DNA polymerase III alpha subunit